MKRFILGTFLFCIVFLLSFGYCSISANEPICTIRVLGEDKGLELGDIVFDVYSAECTYSEQDSGTYVYSETYYMSISPDENGFVSFEKPSECFSVTLKTESLPEGYGTPLKTIFFSKDICEHTFEIVKISKVDIIPDFSDIISENWYLDSVLCYDNNGQQVDAATKIIDKKISLSNIYCIEDDAERNLQFSYEYSLLVSGIEYKVTKQHEYHCRCAVEKADILYRLGIVSQHEYMNRIAADYLYGDAHKDAGYFLECGTEYIGKLELYRKTHNGSEEDYDLIDMALAPQNIVNSKDSKSDTYVDSSSGKFRIHYDNSFITSATATSLAAEFDSVDNLFCSSLGYSRPFNPSTSKYQVYIENITALGTTYPNSGNPYTKISYNVANNLSTSPSFLPFANAYKGVVAHEYFHAIMFTYGIPSSETWMQECFASWAGLRYVDDYAALRKSYIVNFLVTPSLSLTSTSNNRHYGSCVFPLYIYKTKGNVAIKDILSSYSSPLGALYAVNSGLNLHSSSLSEAYSVCSMWNYDTDYYYQPSVSGTSFSWGGADKTHVSTYPYSASGIGLPGLASKYIEFTGPSTPKTLSITIDYTSAYGGPAAGIKAIRKTNSGSYYQLSASISSGRCTIVQNNFGSSIAKKITIIPMNTSESGLLSVSTSASLS